MVLARAFGGQGVSDDLLCEDDVTGDVDITCVPKSVREFFSAWSECSFFHRNLHLNQWKGPATNYCFILSSPLVVLVQAP